ncbi:flavodoxin [bacterium SCSIO 12741]|nr:flavodoxin [bacterium SCSIO 12741]
MKEQVIGLFWGSDTGATEGIAQELEKILSQKFQIDSHELHDSGVSKIASYDYLILGLSTWYDGELQSDWDGKFNEFCELDFTGKTVAVFGLGDQYGYPEWFVDGMGIIAEQVAHAGGRLIGHWPTDNYEYDQSKAEMKPGWFYGLAIDEENQGERTTQRLKTWTDQLTEEFKKRISASSILT